MIGAALSTFICAHNRSSLCVYRGLTLKRRMPPQKWRSDVCQFLTVKIQILACASVPASVQIPWPHIKLQEQCKTKPSKFVPQIMRAAYQHQSTRHAGKSHSRCWPSQEPRPSKTKINASSSSQLQQGLHQPNSSMDCHNSTFLHQPVVQNMPKYIPVNCGVLDTLAKVL